MCQIYNTLQHTGRLCNTLQHTATHCNMRNLAHTSLILIWGACSSESLFLSRSRSFSLALSLVRERAPSLSLSLSLSLSFSLSLSLSRSLYRALSQKGEVARASTTRCNTLQRNTRCSTLQHSATLCNGAARASEGVVSAIASFPKTPFFPT